MGKVSTCFVGNSICRTVYIYRQKGIDIGLYILRVGPISRGGKVEMAIMSPSTESLANPYQSNKKEYNMRSLIVAAIVSLFVANTAFATTL